jgi:hypothetical protein
MLQVQDSGWDFVASSAWGRMESCARVVNPCNFGRRVDAVSLRLPSLVRHGFAITES